MSKWALPGMAAGLMLAANSLAAEWIPIKRGEDTVREIDSSSIKRDGVIVEFIARHTFADKNEYMVKRHEAKYLLISSRVNCSLHTMAQLAIEAYDDKMNLISKQKIQQAQGSNVTPESIDEIELNYVCAK